MQLQGHSQDFCPWGRSFAGGGCTALSLYEEPVRASPGSSRVVWLLQSQVTCEWAREQCAASSSLGAAHKWVWSSAHHFQVALARLGFAKAKLHTCELGVVWTASRFLVAWGWGETNLGGGALHMPPCSYGAVQVLFEQQNLLHFACATWLCFYN